MHFARPFSILLASSLLSISAAAQQPSQRDSQAVTLARKALTVLTGGTAVNDAILTGTATRIAGSDRETGSATLKVRGTDESRLDLAISTGSRLEIRRSLAGSAEGYWSGPDTIVHPVAPHNCWADAAWFFPPLSFLASSSRTDISISYVGREIRDGLSVEHLRFSRYVPSKSATATELIQRLSTTEIYLDSASLLPVAMVFNAHPDNDAGIDIPVEIRFSDYRVVNGIRVPFRIQKFIQGGLTLDLSISTVILNTGLPESDFSVR